jgi:hypothetical protein
VCIMGESSPPSAVSSASLQHPFGIANRRADAITELEAQLRYGMGSTAKRVQDRMQSIERDFARSVGDGGRAPIKSLEYTVFRDKTGAQTTDALRTDARASWTRRPQSRRDSDTERPRCPAPGPSPLCSDRQRRYLADEGLGLSAEQGWPPVRTKHTPLAECPHNANTRSREPCGRKQPNGPENGSQPVRAVSPAGPLQEARHRASKRSHTYMGPWAAPLAIALDSMLLGAA